LFGRLAQALADENKKDSAILALDRCMTVIPPKLVPFNFFALSLIDGYYRAGANEKAVEVSKIYVDQCAEELNYFLSLPDKLFRKVQNETELNLYILQELHKMPRHMGRMSTRRRLKMYMDWLPKNILLNSFL